MSAAAVTVIRTTREIEALGDEWDGLSARFGSPLLDADWFISAAARLHDEQHLRVVVVREQGRLSGVAPLAVDRAGRHLVLLGTQSLHEPSGWIYSSVGALARLTAAVLKLGEAIVLDRIPAGTEIETRVPRLVMGRGIAIVRAAGDAYGVSIRTPWSSYYATLSSHARQRLSAARRRAEREVGPVTIERLAPGPDEVRPALALLTRVEAAGWKGRAGSALAQRPELAAFFAEYATRAAARGTLRVSVLSIGGTPAAAELGVEAYGRMWGLKIGYDERFAAFAPAVQLRHATIQAAFEARLQGYEFLGSTESWQERWKPERRMYRLAAIYPFRPRSMVTAVQDAAHYASHRWKRARPEAHQS